MQDVGYMILCGKKILLLRRVSCKTGKHNSHTLMQHLKIRKSGKDGQHFESEQNYINDDLKLKNGLLDGSIDKFSISG